jgi:hypothetical protein
MALEIEPKIELINVYGGVATTGEAWASKSTTFLGLGMAVVGLAVMGGSLIKTVYLPIFLIKGGVCSFFWFSFTILIETHSQSTLKSLPGVEKNSSQSPYRSLTQYLPICNPKISTNHHFFEFLRREKHAGCRHVNSEYKHVYKDYALSP